LGLTSIKNNEVGTGEKQLKKKPGVKRRSRGQTRLGDASERLEAAGQRTGRTKAWEGCSIGGGSWCAPMKMKGVREKDLPEGGGESDSGREEKKE